MTWITLDDQILSHPKFVRAERLAGSTALHLWLGLLSYCKRRLTDGVIPLDMVPRVDGPARRWRGRALEALATAELVHLDREAGVVRMHDYLDHNDSRAHVERKLSEKRARDEARKAAYLARLGHDTNTGTTTDTTTDTKLERAPQTRSKKGKPSKSPARPRWRNVADAYPEWQPTEYHGKLALKYGKDLRVEAARYRDHDFAVAKSDPDRTFNNWLRRTKGDL